MIKIISGMLVLTILLCGCSHAFISTDKVENKVDKQTEIVMEKLEEIQGQINNIPMTINEEQILDIEGRIIVIQDELEYLMKCLFTDEWDVKPAGMYSLFELYQSTFGVIMSTITFP